MSIETVLTGLVLLVLIIGILSTRAAYHNGVNDGYGYSQDPTCPGYKKAGKWLFQYTRHLWNVRDPNDETLDTDEQSATPTAQDLAVRFHETYERLAPSFGYETRTETRSFDPTTPNGRLMIAVCSELLTCLPQRGPDQGSDEVKKYYINSEDLRIPGYMTFWLHEDVSDPLKDPVQLTMTTRYGPNIPPPDYLHRMEFTRGTPI